MRESRLYGFVRGALSNERPYRVRKPFAAAHESLPGPSRRIAAPRNLRRFRCRADIRWHAGPAGSVASDPTETLAARFAVLQSALFPITVW
jgi:hypothetical protein